MALHTIPVLPADYPLFDWEDWPKSRAALVRGGPTKEFEVACWNAMVDCLSGALDTAGIEWLTGEDLAGNWGYSPEQTKITNGHIYGYQFNRMIRNIYARVPLNSWLWEYDTTYRGYLGRLDLKQSPTWKSRDYVYPEYFTHLVFRLNQLIELMRGTWPISDLKPISLIANLPILPGVHADQSIPLFSAFSSHFKVSQSSVDLSPARPILAELHMGVPTNALADVCLAAQADAWQESHFKIQIEGEVIRPARVNPRETAAATSIRALLEIMVMAYTGAQQLSLINTAAALKQAEPVAGRAQLHLLAACTTLMDQRKSIITEAQKATESLQTADADTLPAAPTDAKDRSKSRQLSGINSAKVVNTGVMEKSKSEVAADVEGYKAAITSAQKKTETTVDPGLRAGEAKRTSAKQKSDIKRDLTVIKGRTRPAWSEGKTRSTANILPEKVPVVNVDASASSKVQVVFSLGTAWEPPIWQEDGLWIRQARTIKILPDGSMDLSGSGDPIAAEEKSRITSVVVLDTGWMPPVWMDDGLYIRQVREVKVMKDGSLDLTGAGYEMAVRQGSGTHLSAALDTGWYPPVVVGNGIYLRQVYDDPVQNENGELEVW